MFAFDIDGVVIDSEPLHFKSLEMAVGIDLSHLQKDALVGLSMEETLRNAGVKVENFAMIADLAEKHYLNMISAEHLRPHVRETIATLLDSGRAVGFVSNASRAVCEANLSLLNLSSPAPIVSCDDVDSVKPSPEPYRKLCKYFDIEPSRVVVVEDTDLGILSAYRTGIRKIYAWPHALSNRQNYALSFATIHHLSEISELSFQLRASNAKKE